MLASAGFDLVIDFEAIDMREFGKLADLERCLIRSSTFSARLKQESWFWKRITSEKYRRNRGKGLEWITWGTVWKTYPPSCGNTCQNSGTSMYLWSSVTHLASHRSRKPS